MCLFIYTVLIERAIHNSMCSNALKIYIIRITIVIVDDTCMDYSKNMNYNKLKLVATQWLISYTKFIINNYAIGSTKII